MSFRNRAWFGIRRTTRLTGVALAAVVAVSACGGPSSTGAAAPSGKADTIEAGISYGLSTGFDPMNTSGATPFAANLHIFEALVDLDPVTRKSYPALAEAMPEKVSDTSYRVKLRSGATFHNGDPVTAEDVAFTFGRILDPANKSLMRQFLPFLASVTAVDERTVEFTLSTRTALFAERLAVARIVPKKVVTADPKGFDAKPVGSGPYALVEAIQQDKIVFKGYDRYNGPRPAKVPNLVWRLTADPASRVSAIESGQVHAIEDVPYTDVQRLSQKIKVDSVQSFGMLFLMFNTSAAPFSDKRVRQALHYAMDTQKIIGTAMAGNGTAATSYVQKGHPEYVEASTVYTLNQDKAKALLAEAGVGDLSITLSHTDTGWVKDIAPLVKASWDAIGVKTTLDVADSAGTYKKVDAGQFQVLLAPGDPSVFGNDLDLLMRWFYANDTWVKKRFRWDGAPQKQVVALLDQAAGSVDAAERKKLWGQAIDIVADEVPLYPILHRKLPTAWNDKALPGFGPLPTTGLAFLDVGRA
ncbi:ABC-type dipeptide transport system, periplasmic component [Alloactinosynnema sp. L-07]|uniref:ABC transporter substrate-binding protein n=1 Tax=Alloactinosynnema sp. L-07 TaxID=1653480 RepID=UPI00065EFBE6|nr:ABC transporter substrate-binding protein [Alloactinosynnema sp. L-07]CRK56632.1 ABC-type dipeptide transport system, periplasmic component [Alloactinosynnema sp. L-07]